MAPIGLAHRSTLEFVAEWTDVETGIDADDPLRAIVDLRRRDAADAASAAGRQTVNAERRTDEPSPDGWLAGEPMF